MRKPRIYLDTSVISFLFAEDAPEFRAITEEFFHLYVATGLYEVAISEVVIAEIERTNDPIRRSHLRSVVAEYGIPRLHLTEEAASLAAEYLAWGVIPPRYTEDARHIAIATCHEMDVLLSWNFKHLANIKKQTEVRAVNERNGYLHPLLLATPMEVFYEDR